MQISWVILSILYRVHCKTIFNNEQSQGFHEARSWEIEVTYRMPSGRNVFEKETEAQFMFH